MGLVRMAGVHVTILVMLFSASYELEETYTSSTLCSRGSNQTSFYKASCKDKLDKVGNASREVQLIAVTKVLYGAKPAASQCAVNGSATECCSHAPGQDCLVEPASGGYLFHLAEDCNGAKACEVVGKKIKASAACPSSEQQYKGYTTYSMFEYQCINRGLLENMCHEGVVKEAEDLYLASNIYFQNKNKDDDCFCKVSTTCGSHIIFEAVDIRLSRMAGGGCGERITFSDVKTPNNNHSITCYDKYLQMKPVFETISNVGYVHMNVLDERNLGHVWIHVTSSYKNATVRLYCGLNANLAVTKDHMCEEDKLTSQPSTSSTPSTTQEPSSTMLLLDCRTFPELCDQQPAGQTDTIGTGAIVGIVIAGVMVLFVLFILIVLLMRRFYCHSGEEHVYEHGYIYDNHNETLKPPVTNESPAFVNGSYVMNGHASGAVVAENPNFGYITPTQMDDDGYRRSYSDNLRNEAVDTGTQAAVSPNTGL